LFIQSIDYYSHFLSCNASIQVLCGNFPFEREHKTPSLYIFILKHLLVSDEIKKMRFCAKPLKVWAYLLTQTRVIDSSFEEQFKI